MRVPKRFRPAVVTAAAAAAVAIAATPALASPASTASTAASAFPAAGAAHAVFVQTDNTAGNHVVAYRRAADGTLSPAGSYATGGRGGILAGSVVDHTASQGSLTYDPAHALLYAVNAGSNTISVFAVSGDRLRLREILSSGGTFPVSVAVRGDLVYVLNALNGGSLQGYLVAGDFLVPLRGSHRALGLNPNATPQFTNTPGQVAFSPDGSQLIVTTKANGNDIDVFGVGFGGRLSARPTVNTEPGTVPFAITFDVYGHLVIAEAGHECPGHLRARRARDGHPAQRGRHRPGRDLLGGPGRAVPVRVQRGQRQRERLHLLAGRPADAARRDRRPTPARWTRPPRPAGRSCTCRPAVTGSSTSSASGSGGALTPLGSVTVPGAAGGEGIVAF